MTRTSLQACDSSIPCCTERSPPYTRHHTRRQAILSAVRLALFCRGRLFSARFSARRSTLGSFKGPSKSTPVCEQQRECELCFSLHADRQHTHSIVFVRMAQREPAPATSMCDACGCSRVLCTLHICASLCRMQCSHPPVYFQTRTSHSSCSAGQTAGTLGTTVVGKCNAWPPGNRTLGVPPYLNHLLRPCVNTHLLHHHLQIMSRN